MRWLRRVQAGRSSAIKNVSVAWKGIVLLEIEHVVGGNKGAIAVARQDLRVHIAIRFAYTLECDLVRLAIPVEISNLGRGQWVAELEIWGRLFRHARVGSV